jgi:RNA polymerase sigma-70 factor (ECF subfamily)
MNTIGTQENVHEQLVALVPRLRRFARNLVRNHDDADDVVQIALERALKNWSQWRTDARLDGWLFKIVRNAWIDEVRSRKRRNQVFVAEEAGEEVGSDAMEQASNAMSVQSAMARLPEDQRTAVSLVLVEGLPYKEAADVLDIPIGTLTSRLARARAALQTLLEAEGERR